MSPNSLMSAFKSPSLSRLFGRPPSRLSPTEPPLRAELFALGQLHSHGRLLAESQQVEATPGGPERLLQRLRENERVIRASYAVVAEAVRRGLQAAPGAEWLLDNFYLIEEQIDIARAHLPPGYSRELPRLRSGPLAGFPRVYELALELVSHTDGRIDMENLSHFVRGFQDRETLRLGELWAVPIMLRLALLENLRRVTYRTASRRRDRDQALAWAQRFLDAAQTQPKQLITDLADFVREAPEMSQAFIAELCTSLQGQHAALGLVIGWIQQDLAERGQTIDQIVQAESHDQAADRISIGNSITSLRTLTALDWHEFVEDLSVTEARLREDPLGVYAQMDFATRDRYRHVVERLARWSGWTEEDVAAAAVRLAAEQKAAPAAPGRSHVGYFLVADGRAVLDGLIGYRPPLKRRLGRALRRRVPWVYVLGQATATAVVAGLLLVLARGLLAHGWWYLVPLGLALLVFVSQSAISVLNWLATLLVPVRTLPRMDFAKGIPPEHRTVVVIPTLLGSREGVDALVESIEIRYLANRGPNLLLALLTDLPDAPEETLPGDDDLVRRAADGIGELNRKYAEPGESLFYLLHRPRLWNPSEGVWMGRERKRGKLMDLNRLLREGEAGAFSTIAGNVAGLRGVRYVIVLDTDTQLPPETAAKMVGTLAHPLNRPQPNPQTGCVTLGYGVLQPRVAVTLTGAARSLFARLYAGEVGIDPYTREVSNVYHDLFARSPFIGKGIYDLEAFDRAVRGRFPANRILSHDLIEGCYANCGFVGDVELIEDHPSRYLADIQRRHRWVRGDWQIAAWLLPRVPAGGGRREANPLGRLPRWMLFDNLRRSLQPLGFVALLVAGWLGMPEAQPGWTLWILATFLAPEVLRMAWSLAVKPGKVLWAAHLRRAAATSGRQIVICLLHLAFLPFETLIYVDAVARVAWRTLVSQRHLLEWQTAHDAEAATRTGLLATARTMWVAPVTALAVTAALVVLRYPIPVAAGPLLALWLASPLLAWLISRPTRPRPVRLSAGQVRFLRRLARRTWMYFEHFVGPSQNWLPPDNFQERPSGRVTERTSPTNIGLALASTLAAHDFGYVSAGQLVERVGNTLTTLNRLRRYREHFVNWYDTWTLEPLRPAYISTVDSGNLAGCMVALRGGLLELAGAPLIPPRWREGLEDTAGVLAEEIEAARKRMTDPRHQAEIRAAGERVAREAAGLASAGPALADAAAALADLATALADLAPMCQHDSGVAFWLAAIERQANDLHDDLLHVAPWLADGAAAAAATPAPEGAAANPGPGGAGALREAVARVATLRDLAALEHRLGPPPAAGTEESDAGDRRLREAVATAGERAAARIRAAEDLALRCEELAELELDFLYDPMRKLLSIGYSLDGRHRDPGYYDLFASESRLASFLGIAQGRLPQEHWFLLGRQSTPGLETPTLLSWSGSMFEYLMPMLLMPTYEGTLLDQACRGAVARQMRYGRRQGVPWGISESCYNQVDAQMNYQYRAFGVPELGLKRGLADDLVIAPYAGAMALMVMPEEACANLQAMAREDLVGRFGLYEAVDYTASRLKGDQSRAVVPTYMAHHSGMSLLALGHTLLGRPMQRRFLSDPRMRATVLLLQERIPAPRETARRGHAPPPAVSRGGAQTAADAAVRIYTNPDARIPHVHLLSNGRYHVMVTSAGGGVSRWQDLNLTRWREDVTRDDRGFFFYLQDVEDGYAWSSTHQPLRRRVNTHEAIFSQARAEFHTVHRQIEAHTQISVSPEDDIELRRIVLTNLSNRPRTIELTSFAAAVLADPTAELAHPAFNALFIETEAVANRAAVLCTRRPRSAGESPPWMFHALIAGGPSADGAVSFETDRARFIGRGRSTADPAALDAPGPLSNTAGPVLDPCVAVRRRVRIEPNEAVTIDAVTGVGRTRDEAMTLVDRYHDARLTDRVFELAWTHSQVLLHHLGATEADAQLFARLASSILFANPRHRANASQLARNRKGQADLWRYGISGDLPIVLLRVTDPAGLTLVRRVIQAHAYWRQKGLRVDLVIWADAFAGYRQSLWDEIMGVVGAGPDANFLDQHGGIFVRSTDQLPEDDRLLLQSVARVVLSDRGGTLLEQVDRRRERETGALALKPSRRPEPPPPGEDRLPPRRLDFFNGLGGFTPDGREYVILLPPGAVTPAPWANVLANERFGTIVTESGGGYTWFENAHEYRLTPWHNDPVSDPPGEAFYVRDEETGRFWSPAPGPARGRTPYVCRHGLGYTVFEHTEDRLFAELWTYVAVKAPVKLTFLTIRNLSDRARRLSVTGYAEWVLGQDRGRSAMHVVTRVDPQTGAILASSPYGTDFADHLAFFHTSEADRSLSGDRGEFIGRNGSLASPAAMRQEQLSGHVGAGLDPCGAVQAFLTIPAGQERQVVFVLGAARSEAEVHDLLQRFSGIDGARVAREEVWEFWKRLLGGVYVETPDETVNLLANHWLLYQVVAGRFWGRSGFYQSGGAYGFRDQLQDTMAMLHECPELIRGHLLASAGRQFAEGDVQHWWHPPTGRGVRTRFSDDYLWLPYAVCRYVTGTGDTGVLDEQVPFLDGREVAPGEESYYDLPLVTEQRTTLYEHCARAIRRGAARMGAHGLPLIGCGDWNDGLNRVGKDGRGESVWLAFFLHDVLTAFAPVARRRADGDTAALCQDTAEKLRDAIEAHAWDGRWYRRAYFDDGRPLGAAENVECCIDSLPQSWAVLSGAARPDRARTAMQSVLENLVDWDRGIVRLFTPPFDKEPWDPGYIKGYVPGVRENGGQYTHAAVWVAMAMASLGQAETAWRLASAINPIRHGDTPARAAAYMVEPYVIAADVYTCRGHEGRGGWTWYTGSAAWMYRLLVESLLGISIQTDVLTLHPVVPPHWKEFTIHYRFRTTPYHIGVTVAGPETWNVRKVVVDGAPQPGPGIQMADDHRDHTVEVEVG